MASCLLFCTSCLNKGIISEVWNALAALCQDEALYYVVRPLYDVHDLHAVFIFHAIVLI